MRFCISDLRHPCSTARLCSVGLCCACGKPMMYEPLLGFRALFFAVCPCVRAAILFDKFWFVRRRFLGDLAMCMVAKCWHFYFMLYFLSLFLKASFPPSRISQTCSLIPCAHKVIGIFLSISFVNSKPPETY